MKSSFREIVVGTEGAQEAISLEGTASEVNDSGLLRQIASAYNRKYNSDLEKLDRIENPIYAVKPSKVFGFIENSKKISGNPTRWSFEGPRKSTTD